MSFKLKHYLDFDLQISRSDQGYRARVLNAPMGAGSIEFSLPFSEMEIENFILRLGHNRQKTRRLESTQMETAKQFGGQLFQTVFIGDVLSSYVSSIAKANQDNAGLRIRLRLADAPELIDLPWEFLYNPSNNRFLTLSVNTPLVRYLELPDRITPLPVESPLRILVMIANPSDYTPLDVEQEWNRLKESLETLEMQGLVVLDRIRPTLVALQQQLRNTEYHIFHFIGHSGFHTQVEDGVLILEDESGKGREVSGQYLGMLLHDERTLRLAVLNSCEGGRTSRHNFFVGVAQSLLQQGIPAVIAMQFEVTDHVAVTVAREFYSALANGYPVDAALSEARKGVFANNNDVEWATPVLYTSVGDGQIFQIQQSRTTQTAPVVASPKHITETPPKSEELLPEQLDTPVHLGKRNLHVQRITGLAMEVQKALIGEDWATAIQLLEALLTLEPNYKGAQDSLDEARSQQDLAKLYNDAQKHLSQKQWLQSKELLTQLFTTHPTYRDVRKTLADIEKAISDEIAELWKTALSAMRTENWDAAKDLLEKFIILDPNDVNAANSLQYVIQHQRAVQVHEQAQELYKKKQYDKALALLNQVQRSGLGEKLNERIITTVTEITQVINRPTVWQWWKNVTIGWVCISLVSGLSLVWLWYMMFSGDKYIAPSYQLFCVWIIASLLLTEIIFSNYLRLWRIKTHFLLTLIVGCLAVIGFVSMGVRVSMPTGVVSVFVWLGKAPLVALILGIMYRRQVQPEIKIWHIGSLVIFWFIVAVVFLFGMGTFAERVLGIRTLVSLTLLQTLS